MIDTMIFDFRLQVFHTAARRLSFTKAAEELFITQPAVTKHIKELEHQFNNKLFERRGNNIVLTQAGKVLQLHTQELVAIYNKMEEEMASLSGGTKGNLNIGSSTTIAQYILPAMFADFRSKFNDVSLKITTKNTEDIEQGLISGEIDLGFIEGHIKNKQIKYIPFLKDDIVLVGRAGHPWASKKNISIADLLNVPLIMREYGSGTLEVVRFALEKAGLKWNQLNIEMQLDSTEAAKSYLLHSDSLAFISKHAINVAETGNLFEIISIKNLTIQRPLNAIHLHGTPSKLAQLFLKFILNHNHR